MVIEEWFLAVEGVPGQGSKGNMRGLGNVYLDLSGGYVYKHTNPNCLQFTYLPFVGCTSMKN